ncbi:hypothetical protein B9Z55_027044 [Caenorhabditis nigoni]|uniref:F-box domain-containing protein n=1 Tax=Caenorhabditis nigoni TaxID=1611254 RepID=A0A2G5SJ02_9PELO|nr:hypothetical protein B9Z55_027044 [Caenorhabditis nigoni]
MELSSDFIKENQHFLRSCILYEVLQKKSVFSAYQNFCDTVGKDAMEYPDFEFWFYRFYQGKHDLHHDRSADPESKTLVDMPVVLMNKITQHLDPIERARLRYMNHAMKDVADSFPPLFDKIDIVVSDKSLYWTLNDKRFSCSKKGSGSILRKPNSSKSKASEKCYMEKGIEQLALVLKTCNFQVNHVSVRLSDEKRNCDGLLPVPFNAKSACIYGYNTNQVVHSLSAMNPGHLESISLDGVFTEEPETYGMIFETDRFKQAKSVNFAMSMEFNVEDLASFSHLKNFKCLLTGENTFEDASRIRDVGYLVNHYRQVMSCLFSDNIHFRKT